MLQVIKVRLQEIRNFSLNVKSTCLTTGNALYYGDAHYTDREMGPEKLKKSASLRGSRHPQSHICELPSLLLLPVLLNSWQYGFGEKANILQPHNEETGNWEEAWRETGSGICQRICFPYRPLVSYKEI